MRLTHLFDQEYVKPTPQAGDIFEFELDDNTVIETTIAGVDSEGNVELYLDETAINMIEQRGMLTEHIVKVAGGYELKSKHGNKNLGKYPTKAGAEKRERQVQYFKHMGEEGVAEGFNDTIYPNAEVIKSKNGKPVGEIYQDASGWGCFHYKADNGADSIESREEALEWLKDIAEEYRQDRSLREQGVAESQEDSPVANAITRRIMNSRADLLSKYGPVKIMQAIDDVAEWVGDVDEIGSSDVSAWVRQVEQSLDSMNEAAPTALRWASGAALGTVAGAGGVIMGSMLGGVFAPIVGGIAAWNATKMGMAGADEIWDWAASKLGGGHNEQDFAMSHVRAAASGKDTFEYRGKEYPVTLPKTDVNKAVQAIKSVAESKLEEAKYHGKEVTLGKPVRGGPKKFYVYVRDPSTKNIKKVNFGDPNMRIKKSSPKHRKSFRARHNCANPGPRTKARYWSCRKW